MRYIFVILVLLASCGGVLAQGSPPVFTKWEQDGDAIYNKKADSLFLYLINGSDTSVLWISSSGIYWNPATLLDSLFLDSLRTAAGRFDGGPWESLYGAAVLKDTTNAVVIGATVGDYKLDVFGHARFRKRTIVDTVIIATDTITDFTGTNLSVTDGVLSAATGGTGGWTDQDPYIVLEAIGDSVGIGTATPSTKLEVVGETKTDTLIVDTILSIGGDDFNELVGGGLQITAGSLQVATDIQQHTLDSGEVVAIITDSGFLETVATADIEDSAVTVGKIDHSDAETNWLNAIYQLLEATLTDIADGTIEENLVNTTNPWADNEVADDITINEASDVDSTGTKIAAALGTRMDNTGDTVTGTYDFSAGILTDIKNIDWADTIKSLTFYKDSNVLISDSQLMTKKWIDDNIAAAGGGDVTDVVGGDGLKDDGNTGSITVDAIAGYGIVIVGDSIEADTTTLKANMIVDSTVGAERATLADSAGSSADENVQDKVGAMFTDSAHSQITAVYDDAGATVELALDNPVDSADGAERATKDVDANTISTTYMKRSGALAVTGDQNWGDLDLTNVEIGSFDTINVETLGVSERFEINGDQFTDLTGTGIINDGGALSVSLAVLWDTLGSTDTIQYIGTEDSALIRITRDTTNDTTYLKVPVGWLVIEGNRPTLISFNSATRLDSIRWDSILSDIRNPASTDSFYVAESLATSTGWKQSGDSIFVDTSSGSAGGGNPIRGDTGVVVTFDSLVLQEGTGIEMTIQSVAGDDTINFATTLGTSVDLTSEVTDILPVPNGGTGVASHTSGSVLLGTGSSDIGNSGTLQNGMLVIGDASRGEPVAATLTEGEAIDISEGAGSITISAEDATSTNKGVAILDDSTWKYITIGNDSTSDHYVYFEFGTTDEYIIWDSSAGRFEFSDELLAEHLFGSNWGGVGDSWRLGYWGTSATPSLYFWNNGVTNAAWLKFDTTTNQFNVSNDFDVTGNISVSGTVDDVDVLELHTDYATDSTKLDGIEAGATADQTEAELEAVLDLEDLQVGGNLAMGTNKITGLGTPTSPADAATKQYVDDSTTGIGNLDVYGDAVIHGNLVQNKKSLRLNTAHAYATNAADYERLPIDTLSINITETADTFCAVDPSEVYYENGSFYGYKIAGVHTPIPTTAGEDSAVYENPMFYVCKDYDSIPTFLNIGTDTLNYPVLTPDSFGSGPGPYDTVTHLSDPKLNTDADGILWMYVRVTIGGITYKVIAGYFDTTGGPHFVWTSDGGDTLWTGLEGVPRSIACTTITAQNSYTYKNAAIITAKNDTVRVSWTSPGLATTVGMVCDSMVKYINDDAGFSARYTAYDSASFYVIKCKTSHVPWVDSVDANQDTSMHVDRSANTERGMITPAIVTDTSRSYTAFVTVGGAPGGLGRDMLRYQSAYPCSGFVMTDSFDMPDSIPMNWYDSAGMANHIDVTVASPSDWLLCAAVTNTQQGSEIQIHGGEMWIFHSYDRGYTWQDSVYVMKFNPDNTEWDSKYIYGWDITSIEEYGDGYLLRVIYSAKDSTNSHWHSGRTIIYLGQDTTETNLTTYVTGVVNDTANALRDGDTWTGDQDYGGATSFELPNDANPTTDAEGEIAWDSDDDMIEVYSGDESESAVLPIHPSFQATLFNPDDLTDSLPMYDVGALQWPGGIEIDSIQVTTSEDGTYALGFITYSNTDPPVLGEWIDTLNVGASDQKANSVLFYDAAIEVGKTIYVSIPATDIAWVKFSVWFHGKDND